MPFLQGNLGNWKTAAFAETLRFNPATKVGIPRFDEKIPKLTYGRTPRSLYCSKTGKLDANADAGFP